MKFEVTFCLKIEIMTEMNWLKWKIAYSVVIFLLEVEWILFSFGSVQVKTNSAEVVPVYDETMRPESSQNKLNWVTNESDYKASHFFCSILFSIKSSALMIKTLFALLSWSFTDQ